MKILNYGSMNYDYTYQVEHMVRPGETIASGGRMVHCGGKGFNQSIALARAGANVYHAGMIGDDGERFLEELERSGVDVSLISRKKAASGHAIIQVNPEGENSIILYEGANGQNSKEQIKTVFEEFEEGDWVLLQNEINLVDAVIEKAWQKKMKIILNPSPLNDKILACDLKKISMFLVNETEGTQMTGKTDPAEMLDQFLCIYPESELILTLGKQGAIYQKGAVRIRQAAFPVEAVDTTAAGDTFTGFYLAAILEGLSPAEALQRGCAAAAIAVQKKGAAASIPELGQVNEFLKKR